MQALICLSGLESYSKYDRRELGGHCTQNPQDLPETHSPSDNQWWVLLEFINKKYEDIPIDEIRKLIWMNSSRINTRIKYEIYNEEKWNIIKDYVIKTQKYLLDSAY